MAIGVRILSNNLSGKTANVTFDPVTGGTFDLGTKTVPFNNIDSYPYGIYNLYFAEYDYTYSLLVPDPTPLEFILEVEYFLHIGKLLFHLEALLDLSYPFNFKSCFILLIISHPC